MAILNKNICFELDLVAKQLEAVIHDVDTALDRGDRRAFRVWSGKYRDLSARCTSLLLRIATADS